MTALDYEDELVGRSRGPSLVIWAIAATLLIFIIWAAFAWTLGVTAFLLWHFLAKRDERRLLVELKASYPDAVRSRSSARRSR